MCSWDDQAITYRWFLKMCAFLQPKIQDTHIPTGPCCRQDPVFFVAIEWAFISDPDAQLRQRAAGKRRREAAQRARKREDKMIDEQRAEIELEDGEIQE